jgi:hypothetical protein
MAERKCSNCAFCERLKLLGNENVMRCWHKPGVCDHAFVQPITEAENYVCEEHRYKEEREKELFEEAKYDYKTYKERIRELEEKYPQLKEMNI